ncbi:MAG TPA: adenylyltransferase/cytidyltransferase family protein [Prolixibacteraceae bacterium]|nr:adenylyltransferase/cytidyltransferase family protein [Prolixibacteraceae bacterium]HRV87866.1 adenylyltransferase/cytidyltransferase family protein [Prolixibacteraceae bacterium]
MDYTGKIEGKIFGEMADFLPLCRDWREAGEKIVFTNGCFDLLHRGHAEYLARAAALGDRLVVGLNTDASVARLKGPGRPLTDQWSRAWLVAALEPVSAVVLFNEATPLELIKAIRPHFLIKGSDYRPEEIAGYDVVTAGGGTVATIGLVPGFSTSLLIEKIIRSGK